jgi:hypothetical protein
MRALKTTSREDAAIEGIALFRRLSELSEEAMNAVDAADADTLIHILEERARIIEAVDCLLLNLPSRSERPRETPEGATLEELYRGASLLEAADASLALALASRRDQLAREIDALEQGETARTAYEPRRRGRDNLNVVR